MIVIANPRIVLRFSSRGRNGNVRVPLWYRRQPSKVVLFALTEEDVNECLGLIRIKTIEE